MIRKTNLRQSYKQYKENVNNPLGINDYLKINADYNQFLMDKVLVGHEVTLPVKFGTLCVIGRKQKPRFDKDGKLLGMSPDWVKTKKLWAENPKAKAERKRVFHINSHTDGVRYKFLWSKVRVMVGNKTLYALRVTRANKRALHKRIIAGNNFITK